MGGHGCGDPSCPPDTQAAAQLMAASLDPSARRQAQALLCILQSDLFQALLGRRGLGCRGWGLAAQGLGLWLGHKPGRGHGDGVYWGGGVRGLLYGWGLWKRGGACGKQEPGLLGKEPGSQLWKGWGLGCEGAGLIDSLPLKLGWWEGPKLDGGAWGEAYEACPGTGGRGMCPPGWSLQGKVP